MSDSPAITADQETALKAALNDHFSNATKSWDELIDQPADQPTDQPAEKKQDCDLWDDMPVIDSKEVARTAGIFIKIIGSFSAKAIRPGGYSGVDDLVQDIVPKILKENEEKTKKAKS